MTKKSNIIQSLEFNHLPKIDVDILLHWHGIAPGKQAIETKVSKLHHIFKSNTPPLQVTRWTAEDKELEQQHNATTLSMSPGRWIQLVDLLKQKY